MARYEAGETLASIARTYDCSPPAISYIVSRNREHAAHDAPPPPAAEPQLVKANGNGAAANGAAADPAETAPAAPTAHAELRREPAPARAVEAASDQRRTLHLSLGNGHGGSATINGPANGNGQANGNGYAELANDRVTPAAEPARAAPLPPAGEHAAPRPSSAPPASPPHALDHAHDRSADKSDRPTVQQPRDAAAPRKEGGAFIDRELRSRVDGDIAAFLAAFDAALAEDTQASRFGLREATDRLLRAGARTRIELERLEAKLPLPPRDGAAQPEQGAWRYR